MTEIPTLDERLVEMAGRLREYTGALSPMDLAEAGPVAEAATTLEMLVSWTASWPGWQEVIHTRERQLAMVLGLRAGASWGELLDLVGEQRAHRSMAAVDQAPAAYLGERLADEPEQRRPPARYVVADLQGALGLEIDVVDPVDAWAQALSRVRQLRDPRTNSGITSVILAPGSLRLRLCQALGVQPGGGELHDDRLASEVEDLVQERRNLIDDLKRSTLTATSQREALQRQLVDVLGLAQVTYEVTDQDIVGNVRALVARLAANTRQQDAHRRSAAESTARLRGTLVDQLKTLATYAPGHDEMSVDQLIDGVDMVLANTLGELHAAVKARDALHNHRIALHRALSLPPGAGADQAVRAVRTHVDAHVALVERIHQARMLHIDDAGYCSTCHGEGGQVVAYPCDTVLALSGGDRLRRNGDALPGDESRWLDPDGAHAAATEAERAREDESDDREPW